MEFDFLGPTLISAISTFLVTYVVAVLKLRKDLELKFDVDLQKSRIKPYKKIWIILHSLKNVENSNLPITTQKLEKFLDEIRKWYHEENGGMWLSQKAMRDGFQEVKSETKNLIKKEKTFKKNDPELEKLFNKISHFRTLLTNDLGTRRKSFFETKTND